jgi:DNA-binding response OmpR family regulator
VPGAEPEPRGLVLVVEDDRAIADLVRLYLRREGFGVQVETDGAAALDAVGRLHPVAVVLDIGLPGMDGVEVCRRMRAADDWTPVLFVTARDDEVDRIVGLELGADDYVTKPFSPRELVARVRAVLRRASGEPHREEELAMGPVRVQVDRRRVHVDDREVGRRAVPTPACGSCSRPARPGGSPPIPGACARSSTGWRRTRCASRRPGRRS